MLLLKFSFKPACTARALNPMAGYIFEQRTSDCRILRLLPEPPGNHTQWWRCALGRGRMRMSGQTVHAARAWETETSERCTDFWIYVALASRLDDCVVSLEYARAGPRSTRIETNHLHWSMQQSTHCTAFHTVKHESWCIRGDLRDRMRDEWRHDKLLFGPLLHARLITHMLQQTFTSRADLRLGLGIGVQAVLGIAKWFTPSC